MIWIKSVFVGFVAALITVAAIVIATTRVSTNVGIGGGIVAVSYGFSELMLFPFILAFVLAFRWMLRRQRRRQIVQ